MEHYTQCVYRMLAKLITKIYGKVERSYLNSSDGTRGELCVCQFSGDLSFEDETESRTSDITSPDGDMKRPRPVSRSASENGSGKTRKPNVFSKEAVNKMRAWLFQHLNVGFFQDKERNMEALLY